MRDGDLADQPHIGLTDAAGGRRGGPVAAEAEPAARRSGFVKLDLARNEVVAAEPQHDALVVDVGAPRGQLDDMTGHAIERLVAAQAGPGVVLGPRRQLGQQVEVAVTEVHPDESLLAHLAADAACALGRGEVEPLIGGSVRMGDGEKRRALHRIRRGDVGHRPLLAMRIFLVEQVELHLARGALRIDHRHVQPLVAVRPAPLAAVERTLPVEDLPRRLRCLRRAGNGQPEDDCSHGSSRHARRPRAS